MFWIGVLGLILTAVGDILIGISVLQVHSALSKEKMVDEEVMREVREEKHYVFAGIVLILVGFILNVISLSHFYL
ncbi:hypothetical protein ACFL0C_01560 [Patescibacteria group bacterium]